MTEREILKEFADLEKEDFQGMYEFFARTPEKISALEAAR
jgi:uncharacterized protein (DUF433 family)